MEHLKEASYTLKIRQCQLFYRVVGQGSPLVLIHGFGVSGHIWQALLPYLARRYQVFIVDLPGYGKSTFTSPWRLRDMAPLLLAWLEEVGLQKVSLIGQSMGGAIALHMSALAPETITQIVLISSAGIPLETQLPRLMWRSMRSIVQFGNGNYPWKLIRDVMYPRPVLFWQNTQEMMTSDFRAEMATLTAPALIIWGERDILLPLALGKALHTALPHSHFIVLPGCGHRPMLACPEKLSELIVDFLSSETAHI